MEWKRSTTNDYDESTRTPTTFKPGWPHRPPNGNSNIQLQPLGKTLLSLLHPHCWLRLSPCKYGDVHFCGGYFSNNRNSNNINNNKHNNDRRSSSSSSNGLGLRLWLPIYLTISAPSWLHQTHTKAHKGKAKIMAALAGLATLLSSG